MNDLFPHLIATSLGLTDKQVRQTLALLDDGATIPFISRYRKETTGGLDEVQIESIRDRYEKLNKQFFLHCKQIFSKTVSIHTLLNF